MSELVTSEIFTDGQRNINAANMNGIVSNAKVQPDVIALKPASVTMDVADQFLVLKTDNTLAKARFDTLVNSTSSTLPLADSTKNGMLRQVSGKTTDFVDGTNNCQPLSNLLPAGIICDYAGPNIPAGWLSCQAQSLLRTAYPALFAVIGTTYGAADSTHFTLPNFVGRVPFWNGALGSVGGATSVALSVGHLPSHAHPIVDVAHTHGATEAAHTHVYTEHVQGQTQAAGGSGAWAVGAGSRIGY